MYWSEVIPARIAHAVKLRLYLGPPGTSPLAPESKVDVHSPMEDEESRGNAADPGSVDEGRPRAGPYAIGVVARLLARPFPDLEVGAVDRQPHSKRP